MRRARKLWTVLLTVCCVGVLAVASSPLVAAASPGFDDEASQFELFFDCHPTVPNCPGQGSVTNVGSPSPNLDGQSLRISYSSGTPFMGLDAFHRFPANDSARRFEVQYSFLYQNAGAVQALEFAMNQYIQGTRYEWAMQWEQLGPNGDGHPQWRIWTGTTWAAIGFGDQLSPNTWYALQIDGSIAANAQGTLQVDYLSFTIHGVQHNLGQTFDSQPAAGDQLVAAVQLDGDGNPTPYDLFVDDAHLFWA
jgi:hypothetical protein